MTILQIVNAVLCAAGCLRLILFTRAGAVHRPLASALAYALIVATGSIVAMALFDRAPAINLPQLVINAALIAAVFSVGGNVVELFRPIYCERPSLLLCLLRREKWI